ncbi:hypothetical protein GDO78_017775, partial [Eleutherodactylus coqui]
HGQAEFQRLPSTVPLPESSSPGSSVHSFSLVNCSSNNPTVTITSVSPPASYFNPPTQSKAGPDEFALEITLSPSAPLNAAVTNLYVLTIEAQCSGNTTTGQLFVRIIDDIPEPQCEPQFSSQVGDTVQVYSNVPASSTLYTVALRQPKYTPVTYKITQPSPSPFTIQQNGQVLAPASGFSNTAASHHLQITVTDARGNKCNGTLNVKVLPIYDNPINFTRPSENFTIMENGGPNQMVGMVKARGNDILYEMINPSAGFYIESETGTIRTTYNLDLERFPSLATTSLLVRAYDRYQRSNSATVTVTVTVQDINDNAPQCSPEIVVKVVPQTQPIGFTLADFICKDPDFNGTLNYSILSNDNSRESFRMVGSKLQINKTLNYDSYEIASVNFQYSATVVVTDSGTPKMTTNIPVFITVTAVNDYYPKCVGQNFSVAENAPSGTFVGQIEYSDADYPFNNVQFSIEDNQNPPVFYVLPRTGQIMLLGALDFETRTSYSLKMQVVDLNNDIEPDPIHQLTNHCSIFVQVLDVNDNPPVCTPPVYIQTIYSTLSISEVVQDLTCSDKDVTASLSYTIVGGNVNNRFRLENKKSVMHNPFSFNPDGVMDPEMYELLIQVTDSTGHPQFTTTATVFITVIPWTTTQPTTTKTTPTPEKQTRIVNQILEYWQPDVWFIVVLTITGILLLAALALLTWALCKRFQFCAQGSKELSQPLLPDSSVTNNEASTEALKQSQPGNEKKDVAPVSPLSLQFDGRAQDPVSGRQYLFNSYTGERRWV